MYLKEIEYSLRNETLIHKLTIIWQKSVEATHLFLSPQDIKDILPQVVIGLKQIPIEISPVLGNLITVIFCY